MNVKHVILSLLSVVLLGFASCEKKDEEGEISTAAKIQGQWKMQSWIIERHENGEDSSWTIFDGDDDFSWNIRPDNTIHWMKSATAIDTLDYVLQNDTTLLIRFSSVNEYSYNIRTLTDNALKIYSKEPFQNNPDNYYADTYNFTR